MDNVIEDIRGLLRESIDENSIVSFQRFFKEEVKFYGIKSPQVKKISKEYFKKIKHLSKSDIFGFCELLWKSGYMEEAMIACHWALTQNKKFEPNDFSLFHSWIERYVSNWATCDTFCNHTMGEFLEMYPRYIEELKEFAVSKNRWLRRASAVSLIVPARKGLFLDDIFEIADNLLPDQDDLVQKAYGWLLKVASQNHQAEVFKYVMKNKNSMPRTALRYAIEKMPKELKERAMRR